MIPPPAPREDVDGALDAADARARAAWPDLDVPAAEFRRCLAARSEGAGAEAIARLHAEDLYLACACRAGQERARAHVDALLGRTADRVLGRLALPSWTIDETKQLLRCRLLLENEGGGFETYAARGPLRAWLASAAVRTALRLARPPRLETQADSEVIRAAVATGDDVELDYLKRRYTGELAEASRLAFEALTPRDRNILRSYHLGGAGTDGVAALYRVHRVTAWRWVTRATAQFAARCRTELAARLHASGAEISSVLRLLESRVDGVLRGAITPTE